MKHLSSNHGLETLRVRIVGKVQGVGFRAATVRHAHMLSLAGWVRNAEDDSVEALLQGAPEQVDRMLSWLHVGPPLARVDEVSHELLPIERKFDGFQQI